MSAGRPDPSAGVFETVLVRSGEPQALDAHLRRLAASAGELYGLALPEVTAAAILERTGRDGGEYRVRIEGVPHHDHLEVAITAVPVRPDERQPVGLEPVVIPGGLGAHKWIDRHALEGAAPGAVALIVDDDTVLEAAWSNVWLLDGGRLVTPPLDGRILPGITRARLIALAPTLGLQVHERPIPLTEARAAPRLLLTSSIRLAVTARLGAVPAEDPAVAAIRTTLLA